MKHTSTQALLMLTTLALPLLGCPSTDEEMQDGPNSTSGTDGTSQTGGTSETGGADETGGTGGTTGDGTGGDTDGGMMVGPCMEVCADAPAGPDGVVWTKSAGSETTENCGTYHLGISDNDSVAVFSMLQDNVAYRNEGDGDVTFESLTVHAAGDDGKVGEWNLLSDKELTLPPLSEDEVVGTSIAPGESFSFYVEGVPFASGERIGCVVAEFDTGTHYMNVVVNGSTDPMLEFSDAITEDDEREYGFGSKARAEDRNGRVLVAEGWFDEEMGPGAVAEDGSVYLTGKGTTAQLDITPIAKLDPDGTLAFGKRLVGMTAGQSPGSAHLHPKKVTDQTGDVGSSEMITLDASGNVYVVSNWENGGAHQGVIVRLAPDGTVDYSRSFVRDPNGLANSGSWFHAVAVVGDRLLITGDVYSGYSGDPLLLALDPDTGDLLWSKALVAQPGSANPAWSVCADGDDRVVLTGGSNDGLVASISGVSTDTPTIDWIKKIDVEGAGVKGTSCDIDDAGVAYVAYFGLSTQNRPSMLAVGPDGEALWSGQIGNIGSSRNLAQSIVHHEGSVYLGGVLSLTGLDSTAGEGLLMKVDATDGALQWAAIYYTGKGAEESGNHAYKGIAVRGDEIVLTGQAYTATHNVDWYKGYWYDAITAGAEYGPVEEDPAGMLIDLPNHDPDIGIIDLDEGMMLETTEILLIEDLPTTEELDGLDLEQAGYGFESLRSNAGPGTDADGLVQIVTEG